MKKNSEITDEQISEFQQMIYWYMDNASNKNDDVIRKLAKYLDVSEKDGTAYLEYSLNNASSMFPEEVRYDVLACIVKALDIPIDIPIRTTQYEYKGNILLYEYDPAKNGKNILKHQLSFQEVVKKTLGNPFGEFVVPNIRVNGKGNCKEIRYIYFIKDFENDKGILSVCDLADHKDEDSDKFYKFIASKYLKYIGYSEDRICNENTILDITDMQLYNFFKSLSKGEQENILSNHTAKKRFISSRYFTRENLDRVVEQVISLDNLSDDKLSEIIETAKKILKKEFHLG